MSFPDAARSRAASGSRGTTKRKPSVTHARLSTGGRDDWQTPEEVLERVRRVGTICLDPCTSLDNPVEAENWFTPAALNPECNDGLALPWIVPGLVYVNFPYSQAARWVRKLLAEVERSQAEIEIVSLIAARPDARWFASMVWDSAQAVCFWKGRLRFVGAPSSAPFPSALVYHGPRPWAFEAAFHDAGRVLRL